MKKSIMPGMVMLFTFLAIMFAQNSVLAQQKTQKKKKTIEAKALSTPTAEVTALNKPTNERNPKPEAKTRGDVYGADYSDINVVNYTGYSIDIYVNGSYRGTIAAYDKKVTWAVPGNTQLYAKAVFNDGSYLYWGPTVTYTGYEYTWSLTN